MACEMTTGYNDRTCTNGKGGIKSVLLFPLGATSGAVVSGANELTSLVVAGETFLYKLKSNLSSYTAPIRVDKNNGTLWYEQTLNMILASDSKELRSEIHLLAQNEVMCLVENADGTIVALGLGEGLQVADANEYTSGILKSDRKGHVIVLKGMENDELPDVSPVLYATLIGQQSPSI
ncbi:MAG: hypothetical protein EBR91_11795 [Flavobacteriia bacterium]|nr:hypothetical protein [Flavobacteriia bacterium]